MADVASLLEKGFAEEVSTVLAANEHGVADYLEGKMPDHEIVELGQRAARYVFAPFAWRAIAGHVLDTSQVTELLGVSRQAIAKRVRSRSLFALAGRGISYFPNWQFDLVRREVRPVVKDVLVAFDEALGRVDPLVVLSWSSSPQRDELDGLTPQDWIETGGSPEPLVLAAKRAAFALSA